MGRKIKIAKGTIDEPGLIITRAFDIDCHDDVQEILNHIYNSIMEYDDFSFFIKTIEKTEQ